jgi:hypothetical protein
MLGYLVSLLMGLAVGASYGLVQVRSPAPAADRSRRALRYAARAAGGRHGQAPFRATHSDLHPRTRRAAPRVLINLRKVSSIVTPNALFKSVAHSLNLDPAPLNDPHEFSLTPKPDDGPVTVTRELIIRPEDQEEFLALIKQLRLIFLRNGAFLFRFDENLEHSGTFRTEMLVSSWAEHLRQYGRMTKAETELVERVWAMHAGDEEPIVRHYLPANRLWTPLGFSRFQKQPA